MRTASRGGSGRQIVYSGVRAQPVRSVTTRLSHPPARHLLSLLQALLEPLATKQDILPFNTLANRNDIHGLTQHLTHSTDELKHHREVLNEIQRRVSGDSKVKHLEAQLKRSL